MSGPRLSNPPANLVPQPRLKSALDSAPVLADNLVSQTLEECSLAIAERNAEIRRRYINGEIQKKLAVDYGVSLWTVSDICRGAKEIRYPPSPEKQARNAEIRERYANGESQYKIAGDYGLSGVSDICKGVERKVELKNARTPEKDARNAEIRERFSNGEAPRKLAADYGLTSVYHVCKGVQRKAKPNDKRNAEIRERYANGEKQKKIAGDFGLNIVFIRRICKGVRLSPEIRARDAEICERYANGEEQKDIAADYRLSISHISHICQNWCQNWPERIKAMREMRPKDVSWPDIETQYAEIRERYANGETRKKISADFGLSTSLICYICRGVKRKAKPKGEPSLPKQVRNAEIRKRYTNGEVVKEIAANYRLTPSTISNICKGAERKVKVQRNAEIRERYTNGEKQKDIAADYGLGQRGISSICKGVQRKVKPNDKRNAEIRERYAHGETQAKIAADLELARSRISYICKEVERKAR